MDKSSQRKIRMISCKTIKHGMKRYLRGALVDRGANGSIIGDDARILRILQKEVDVTGIDNHELNSLRMVDAASKAQSQHGEMILIIHQCAYHGKGRSIISAGQVEHYKNKVDDRSIKVGGRQCIQTHEGYVFPLDIINGLPYLKMTTYTDREWEMLPHVILTAGQEWDPHMLDNIISGDDDWYNNIKTTEEEQIDTPFDNFGNYKGRENNELTTIEKPVEETTIIMNMDLHQAFREATHMNTRYISYYTNSIRQEERETKPSKDNHEKYQPYFLHVSAEKVKHTFENTTRYAAKVVSGHNIYQTIKSPYPAYNVWRRNEPVATDTIFSEVPPLIPTVILKPNYLLEGSHW